MAKSAGKVMPRPRGPYDENAVYNIIDMVTYDNKLWVATKSGITGILPSKTAREWMMAVDGTTDVKALETEVDAKFEEIDNNFVSVNSSISSVNSSIASTNSNVTAVSNRVTSAENRISTVEGKFVYDTEPTQYSSKLMTSGGIYDTLNKHNKSFMSDNVSYQVDASSVGAYGQSAEIVSTQEHYYSASMTGGALRHIEKYAAIRANMGAARIFVSQSPKSDNADVNYAKSKSLFTTFSTDEFNLNFEEDGNDSTSLYFKKSAMYTYDSGTYDIGTSDEKFRNIYATTGTIQTSDANEKENIESLDVARARDIIMGLNPVTYKFIDGTSDRTHYGLIAQDVEKTINELGIDNKDFAALIKTQKHVIDDDGNRVTVEGEYTYGLRYDEFTAILIKMCQNLQNEVDELKTEVAALKSN